MLTPANHQRSGPMAVVTAIAATRAAYSQHAITTKKFGIKIAPLSSHEDQ